MKVPRKSRFLSLLATAACVLSASGCGSSSTANVVTVSVTSSIGTTIILGQSTTLTATVTGGTSTNTNVNWEPNEPSGTPCTYTTTTTDSTGKTTTAAAKPCPANSDGSFGTLTDIQETGTATYTAPSKMPDQTTYPGLQLIFTAQSQAQTNKTGTITITLDSGIGVTMNVSTATVPTSEPFQFSVTLTNDLQAAGVTWLVTQSTPTATLTYPNLPTCSPTCGTITQLDPNNKNVETYTAPATIPTSTTVTTTPSVLTLVATSVADNTRIAIATITIIQGGPITFNGVSPNFAPQGAAFWDIYLDAPNMSSATGITVTGTTGSVPINSNSGQIKVLFPIPTTTVTNPASTGARLRLIAANLATAGTYTISLSDPAEPVNLPSPAPPPGAYQFTVVPTRATSVSTVPDDVVQGTTAQSTKVIVDGGYFGSSGSQARVYLQSPSATIGQDPQVPSSARQLNTLLTTADLSSSRAGLYPLYVVSTATPAPAVNNPSVTNIAVFPEYDGLTPVNNPPQLVGSVAAGTNPSAVDIDPTLGIVAVAVTGSNLIQFYSVVPPAAGPPATPATLLPLACPVASCAVNMPTGLSINRAMHTVAVVSYQDQSVQVFPLPGTTAPAGVPFATPVSLANLFGGLTPAPIPYSIGVDPDTNLALVAFSSTSVTTAANVGFVVNLNTGANVPFGCLDSTTTGPCIYSQVTLNSGAYPQVAMAPHGHLAFATPGGGVSNAVAGVDVTQKSTSATILSVVSTAGLVTVTTTAANGLVPGQGGTVLITGVCAPTDICPKGVNFNGMYSVNVTGNTTFTYFINSQTTDSGGSGTVFYGTPNLNFLISATLQGIAINPITRVAAMADANATGQNGSQIDLLNSLNQNVSSITFHATCVAYSQTCANSAELLGTADVAWQPYTNALVSYNPQQNQVSISDPVSVNRYAFAFNHLCTAATPCTLNPSIDPSQITLSGSGSATLTVNNGTTNKLTLFGGLAVDRVTNQAFVVKSGSGTIDIVDLGSVYLVANNSGSAIKSTQITELVVPAPAGSVVGDIGGIPHTIYPQGAVACVVVPPAPADSCDLTGVKIFGSGFAASAQVHLDGVDITTLPGGTVTYVATSNGRELDVTIPGGFLKMPHHYALDVFSSGAQSNVSDFTVVGAVDLSQVCPGMNSQPAGVAVADQLARGPFSPIAAVTVSGCNSVVVVDINPANATFGTILGSPIAVGTTPMGIAISQHRGLAVVTNNGSGNASLIDLTANPPVQFANVSPISTGTSPAGLAINEATDAAIVANTGSNTVTMINFGLLFPPAGTAVPTSIAPISIGGIQQPLSVAIDPDRGTNFQGIAVVGALSLANGSAATGSLAVVDIGLATPALSTTVSSGFVNAVPTGIVFDPIATTTTSNLGLFYANSSGTNTISSFNPDNSITGAINVGINPTSLAINPQTGAILTSNGASNTISIVDTLSAALKTVQTAGLPGSPEFAVAIDQFTNLAVIVDQANQRVLLYPMPN